MRSVKEVDIKTKMTIQPAAAAHCISWLEVIF